MFEPVLQAYIFSMLTMAFIANEAITTRDHIEG
jgi:F0F1-type ATP synthase membrane subunit a